MQLFVTLALLMIASIYCTFPLFQLDLNMVVSWNGWQEQDIQEVVRRHQRVLAKIKRP